MKLEKGTFKAVYIEWLDSVMQSKVWHSFSSIVEDNKKPSNKFFTVGYLVTENKLEYVIAGSIHYEDGEAVSAGQIFKIPKGCVSKIKSIVIK
jgi:hypothetical protein